MKIKSDVSCQIKILLGSRRQLVETRTKVMGAIRGLLKIKGIKVESTSSKLGHFLRKVEKIIASDDINKDDLDSEAVIISINSLMDTEASSTT